MKSILRILADLALLPVTGCIFPPNRDYCGDSAHARKSKAHVVGTSSVIPVAKRQHGMKKREEAANRPLPAASTPLITTFSGRP
jgi:hypothetical protein